jgi:monothiol glutaredoxin
LKGSPTFPQYGFSSAAVQRLKSWGTEFFSMNGLEDADILQGYNIGQPNQINLPQHLL